MDSNFFSKSKTVCMHFCHLRKAHNDPVLTLDGTPIPVVEENKFLGVVFDRKLSFIPHIKQLKAKCQKALNLLRVVAHTDWGVDRKVLLNLYRTIIRSKLDYGSIIYGSARKSYLEMLDPIHHQGLRLALGAFRTSPSESLLAEANEPSLYNRRLKLSMQYALKLKSIPPNPTYETVFEPQYKTLFENKPYMIPSFGIRISSEFENMNLDLDNIAEFHPGPFLSPVFYFHCTMIRSLKLILLFFELNIMSCCLTSLAMRLYLQMVQRMVTQLDQPVLLRLTHINIDYLTMPLFFQRRSKLLI